MKDKVLFENNEFFLLRDYPEKPNAYDYFGEHEKENAEYNRAMASYRNKLKASIAAKTRIDNPGIIPYVAKNGSQWMIYDLSSEGRIPTDGEIFDLPDNVEFEEKYQFYCMGWCDCSEKEYHAWNVRENVKADTQKVILLKLKQEVKIESSDYYLRLKEESQDELITDLWREYFGNAPISKQKVDSIKSKFTIQRIHPEQ